MIDFLRQPDEDYWRSLPREEWLKHVKKTAISPPGPVTLAFMALRQQGVEQEFRLNEGG